TRFLARPDFVRRNAAVAGAGVCAGTSTLESAGHLPFCRCLRRHGTSPPGDDSCLWRSRLVRTLQVALHFCAAVFARSVHGGPFIPLQLLHQGQQLILGAAILVSLFFGAHFVRTWVAGHRPSPVKLALLITSIAFWWYCNNLVASILVGIALFEVFHDVQYLLLVWIYNRNRVEKDTNIGGFMRFIFRRSGSLIGLYVGLVFAYGSLSYINAHI